MLRSIVLLLALVMLGVVEARSGIQQNSFLRKSNGWGLRPIRRALSDEVSFEGDEDDGLVRRSDLDDEGEQADYIDEIENYEWDEIPVMWDQRFKKFETESLQ